jgi:hypothetical protein
MRTNRVEIFPTFESLFPTRIDLKRKNDELATPAGFEPVTFSLEARWSRQNFPHAFRNLVPAFSSVRDSLRDSKSVAVASI